jgi:hypothetical protein
MRPALALILVIAGCAPSVSRPAVGRTPPPRSVVHRDVTLAPLGEADARAMLAAGLRRAGLRIHHDVAIETPAGPVVLDGWDAERRVGFEYVDAGAGDPPLADGAIAGRVLIVRSSDEATLRAALASFLSSLPALPAPPGR